MSLSSLQSLARLAVVRLGCRPYHHLLPHFILDKYSLLWAGVGPIYFFVDGGGNPKLNIGDKVFPLGDAFIHAAREGNLGLTELCKELGADNVEAAMAAAAGGGHESIVRWCHNAWGAAAVNTAMAAAAGGGHEGLVRLFHDEWGAYAVSWAMGMAARGGHEAIVRLCHDDWGAAVDVDWSMAEAAGGGYEAIVRLCHDEWGASHVNWAMAVAAKRGHEAIVRLCHNE